MFAAMVEPLLAFPNFPSYRSPTATDESESNLYLRSSQSAYDPFLLTLLLASAWVGEELVQPSIKEHIISHSWIWFDHGWIP
jgi:hypothetical protein